MILLDTHVVVWLSAATERLSPKAKAAIHEARQSGRGLAICDITLLELAILASRGRIQLSMSIESFLQEIESRFVVLPVTARSAARSLLLPEAYPKDPADRMIGATALVHDIQLITADTAIRRSNAIRTIW